MDLRASEQNSDILRKAIGNDGRIRTEREWQRLDAADGTEDGAYNLAGLTDEMRVELAAAREGGATVRVAFADNGRNDITWDSPVIQEAYGNFLQGRWESWKSNREEADCKTLALRMMDDFRRFYAREAGVRLPDPLPASLRGRWHAYTQERSGGLATQIPESARDDYAAARAQSDTEQGPALMPGTNHIMTGVSAHLVAMRATHAVTERDGQPMITATSQAIVVRGGPDVPAGTRLINHDLLRAGDLIVQNHARDEGRQDNTIDHFMQVLNVERDEETGRVWRLTVVYGTYDDLNDTDHTTGAQWGRTNYYAEEHVIEFDANGQVSGHDRPWVSDDFLNRPMSRGEAIADAYNILGAFEHDFSVRAWGAAPRRR